MLFLIIICVLCLIVIYLKFRPDDNTRKLGEIIPGLPAYPVIGNLLDVHTSGEVTLRQMREIVEAYGTVSRLWAGHKLVVMLTDPKDIEIILKSNKYIEKALVYDFLKPWLGEGLLTSTGEKWHSRRKALTKAFDFKMIEQFIDIFNVNGSTLIEILSKKVGTSFDVRSFVCKCTLDIICETSMGMRLDAQRSKECSFAISLRRITKLLIRRIFNPLLHLELVYTLLGFKSLQTELCNSLHDESMKVIRNREKDLAAEEKKLIDVDEFDLIKLKVEALRQHIETAKKNVNYMPPHIQNEIIVIWGAVIKNEIIGIKEKSIFVDTLLGLRKDGKIVLTDEDIREEIDTVMFAQKVYEEVKNVMGDKSEPSLENLNKFKYLERVILESLRLYPSVPVIARQMREDIQLTKYKLPAGCFVAINIYYLHRNEEYHPNPLEFNPDNFLPENIVKQHPYAYIPFSAGPRICLGKKFAILELKSLLSKLVLKYVIEPGSEDVRPENDMVLQSVNGFNIKITPRVKK